MSSTEYTDMANEISTNSTTCEHGLLMCNSCLLGAATAWEAMKAEHDALIQRMRDEHFETTTQLRADVFNVRVERDDALNTLTNVRNTHETALTDLRTSHNAQLSNVRRTHDEWVAALVADAHQMADDNSLCSRFDDFMAEHGLPTRSRTYDVEVNVDFTVTVRVEGMSRDDAISEISQDDVDDAIREHISEVNVDYRTGYATQVTD
jgi:hypothetical protein